MDLDGLCQHRGTYRRGLRNLRFGKRVEVGLLEPRLEGFVLKGRRQTSERLLFSVSLTHSLLLFADYTAVGRVHLLA